MNIHILLVPSWYAKYQGDTSGSFFHDQAVALAEQGVRVGVIFPVIQYTGKVKHLVPSRGPLEVIETEGVVLLRQTIRCAFRVSSGRHAARVREYGLELYESYKSRYGKPQIIHVHSALYAGGVALAVLEADGVPYVLTEHSSAYLRNRLNKTKRTLAKKVVDRSCANLCVSSSFKVTLEHCFPGTRWSVVPNVLDKRFLRERLADVKQRGTVQFLTVCYFHPNKALDHLVASFASVVQSCPQARLTLGGDGALRPQLEALVNELGIEPYVTFTGSLSRNAVLEYMAQCDVFVLSSQVETFGVVLIEALALGKPVIATRSGGPEDIVNSSNGLLVPVGDHQALAQAMVTMINTRHHYAAETLRNDCLQQYGPSAIAQQLLEVYQAALIGR